MLLVKLNTNFLYVTCDGLLTNNANVLVRIVIMDFLCKSSIWKFIVNGIVKNYINIPFS